ncbi:MAG: hypothetical protein IKW39_01470 [Alphaproteobacteria bacterium]|nr:hypothetical protein [Alphaproteobacteria bacterium]
MSRGPYYAYVEQIESTDKGHKITVLLKSTYKRSSLEFSGEIDFSSLKIGDNICYYQSLPDSQNNNSEEKKNKVVLMFKHQKEASNPFRYTFTTPIVKDWIYIYKGKKILELEKIPRIIGMLVNLSDFYRDRHELVEKALGILEITQDIDTLDALFSMKPDVIHELLGDKVCLYSDDELKKLQPYTRKGIIEDAFIPVQIADLLVSLKLANVDLHNPHRRDLPMVMALAVIHGTSYDLIRSFIQNYKRY